MDRRVRAWGRAAARRMQSRLRALRRMVRREAAEPAWRDTLAQVRTGLEVLNGSTERDFLSVGGRLLAIRQTTNGLASDLAALTDLVAGEHGAHTVDSLTHMRRRAQAIEARVERRSRALEAVRDLSGQVRLAFADLRVTVGVFRELCTLTRIETARLAGTGAGFMDFADQVSALSVHIQNGGEDILDALHSLDRAVRSALGSASDLRQKQLKELPALLAALAEGLRYFQERQRKASQAAIGHRTQYEAVGESIDSLVLAVQAHDITRQQIEHVADALRQLCRGGGRRSEAAAPRDVQAALALQSSQLLSAGGQFAGAVERIRDGLRDIACRVRRTAGESQVLMGGSGAEHDSFFLRMESRFTAILRALNHCAAEEDGMRARAAELQAGILRMRQAVAEIRKIEIQIQHIGLNAGIRAAHIGSPGDALDVIAGVMHRLAVDSDGSAEQAGRALGAIDQAVAEVYGDAPGSGAPPGEGNDIASEIRETILEVHSSSEAAFSRTHQIAALSSRLADDIESAHANFSAGELFADAVAQARLRLQRLCAEEPAAEASSAAILDFAGNYTMQRERDVHREVIEGAAVSVPAPPSAADPDSCELGENVELF